MKRLFKIIIDNSNAMLIFITIISLVLIIHTSLESNRKASANLVCAVELYTELIDGTTGSGEIPETIKNFSGAYFGEEGGAITAILEELKTAEPKAQLKSRLLRLISLYQDLIEDRQDIFNTLFYFLTIGIAIQFVFMIISTRRYRLASGLLDSSKEIVKLLSAEREKERLRISSHLHDSVLQDIGSLLLLPDMQKTPEAARRLRGISDNLREMTYRIAPLHLNTAGLAETISEMTEEFEAETGIKTVFRASGYSDELISNEVRLVLYRTAQESLTNIKKHAEAKNAAVNLVVSHPYLILRIKDDGKGLADINFQSASGRGSNLGMRLMHEQARNIGAVLRGESSTASGTVISLKYKINQEPVNEKDQNLYHR